MRPDEWRQGMENEAASVGDAAWAREVRRAVTGKSGLPVSLQFAIFNGMLLALGVCMAALVERAVGDVLGRADPLGNWIIGQLGLGTFLELFRIALPAALAAVLCVTRFSPLVLTVTGGLAFLPMGAGAYIYRWTHNPLSYETTSGPATVNLTDYVAFANVLIVFVSAALSLVLVLMVRLSHRRVFQRPA